MVRITRQTTGQRRQRLLVLLAVLSAVLLLAWRQSSSTTLELLSSSSLLLQTADDNQGKGKVSENDNKAIPASYPSEKKKQPKTRAMKRRDNFDDYMEHDQPQTTICPRLVTPKQCQSAKYDCQWNIRQCRPMKFDLVSCGGHHAETCAQCTAGGQGASWCNGDCAWNYQSNVCEAKAKPQQEGDQPSYVTKAYQRLTARPGQPFQTVRTEAGQPVNILLVKRPMNDHDRALYERFQHDILFLGISSFENFPKSSPNPFSANFSNDLYRNLFPGFLTMMRNHDAEAYFDQLPAVVQQQEHLADDTEHDTTPKTPTKHLLLSQSDFHLEGALQFHERHSNLPKKYDFVYSGTDQNVHTDCIGWASFAKNWTFLAEHALEIMCNDEFNLTGVLVAGKDKAGQKACRIPPSCHGKLLQTTYLPDQNKFYRYTAQSRFMVVPNIYDASPRVVAQSLALDVPVLLNQNIIGGWKYLMSNENGESDASDNNGCGEVFHDQSNFEQALRKIVQRTRRDDNSEASSSTERYYQPRKYMQEHYGNDKAGLKFRQFIEEHFADRVAFPPGSKLLIPWGS